jgi:hypothetical protein
MELLIVLGLCFGAYELLGVFQGCFHYQDHPLPYQPQLRNSINRELNKNNSESKDDEDEDDDDDDVDESEKNRLDKSKAEIEAVAHRRRNSKSSIGNKNSKHDENNDEAEEEEEDEELERSEVEIECEDEEENFDSLNKSGPCSCLSEFDDDTRIILRNSHSSKKRKSINKFSLSNSLMSLNHRGGDESNFLFNYIDDISSNLHNNKFSRYKSELEITETSFSKIHSHNNDYRRKKKRNCRDSFDSIVHHHYNRSSIITNNIHNECKSSSNSLDTNQKKIFFISAAS